MKPSEVKFESAIPFCLLDTLGNCEIEIAAGIIVSWCKENGNEWKPISRKELGEFLTKHSKKLNPSAFPDFKKLISMKLAKENNNTIALTDLALDLIANPKKWRIELRKNL